MKSAVIIVCAALLVIGCKKDNEPAVAELPEETRIGANAMGCTVNGLVHVYYGKPTDTDVAGVQFNASSTLISVNGNGPQQKGNVFIAFEPTGIDTGVVYSELANAWRPTVYLSKKSPVEYAAKPNDPFNFIVFTRYDDSVAAGRFRFKGFSAVGDSVVVEAGRFDISRW